MKLSLFFFFSLFTANIIIGEVFVTYEPHHFALFGNNELLRSRLGNQLLTLLKAFAIAKTNNYTLVYEPLQINLFDQLKNHIKVISLEEFTHYKKFKPLPKSLKVLPNHDYLLQLKGLSLCAQSTSFQSNIINAFRDILYGSMPEFKPPPSLQSQNSINIGVHIRTGLGFDAPLLSIQYYSNSDLINKRQINYPQKRAQKNDYLDLCKPTKAPPVQFYINAMNYIKEKIGNNSNNVNFVLFTDHTKPNELINEIKKHTKSDLNIISSQTLHKTDNDDLEDLLLMCSLDGLIRPQASTYSFLSTLITNHQYSIVPTESKWIGPYLVVTKFHLKIDDISKVISAY